MVLEPASRIGTLVGVLGSPAGRSGDRDEANRNDANRSEANWDRVEGNWKEFKGKVQQKWGKLTSDDLDIIEVSACNSAVGFSSATAWRRTRPSAKSPAGSRA